MSDVIPLYRRIKCDPTVRDIKLLPMSQIFLSIVVFVVDTGSTLHF